MLIMMEFAQPRNSEELDPAPRPRLERCHQTSWLDSNEIPALNDSQRGLRITATHHRVSRGAYRVASLRYLRTSRAISPSHRTPHVMLRHVSLIISLVLHLQSSLMCT